MASNEKLVYGRYSNKGEEYRATQSKADGLEFHYTKRILGKYVKRQSKVIEIGCGTGYYGMFLSDKCNEYMGIDITQENIEVFNEKILNAKIRNITTKVGDAIKLSFLNANEFDIVLVLGPMYHLPPEERDMVFIEAKRICKDEGILIFAYQNKLGAYLQSGILSYPNYYPNKRTNEYILEKETDDENPGLFYFTTPEEIALKAKKHGLKVIRNVGVNFVFNKEQINNMDEERYKCWLEFSDHMCESESCTGLSVYALLICKKNENGKNSA